MELVHTPPLDSRRRTVVQSQASRTIRVDMALFDGFALPKVAALIEIFHKANALSVSQRSGRIRYDISLLSVAGGRIASSSSVFVWTDSVDTHRGTNDTHVMFIAGGAGVQRACLDERLCHWLRHRHQFSEIVHPIAEGHLLLAAAGRSSRPVSRQDETPGAGRASLRNIAPTAVSTALQIIEQDLGSELAAHVAQSVLPVHKTPFGSSVARGAAPQVSDKIMASARWLDANVDRPISIDYAARLAAMSERNFLRRFKNEIGMTPSDYLLRSRLNLSCQMLVESRLPIDKIARRCGIGSGGQLAKLFRKYLSTTPTAYRTSNTSDQSGMS